MEADLFQRIYDALQLGSKKLLLPVQHVSPITKIIWSSFDYMTGPELKFVWEANCLEERLAQTPFSLSGDEVETDGTDSSDSSFSKTTVNTGSAREGYEDIDDIYSSDLLTAAIIDEEIPLCEYEDLQIKDEFGASSSTLTARFRKRESRDDICDVITNSTTTLEETVSTHKNEDTPCCSRSHLNKSETRTESRSDSQISPKISESKSRDNVSEATKDPMVTSCVDSGIAGTVSFHSDLSANCHNLDESTEKPGSSQSKFYEQDFFDETYAPPKANMTRSFITSPGRRFSNALMTTSMDMTSSFYIANDATPMKREKIHVDHEAELLNELAGEYGMQQLSDDEFIAKFVLAEQICSTQLSSNPLIHKLVVIPSRHIMFGSYLFPLKMESAHPTMAAFSVVLSDKSLEWYLERQSVIEEFFTDIVPRFKAAYLTETIEDLICRLVSEITKIFDLFGALERYNLAKLKIRSSFLWENLDDLEIPFISKCITGALMSKGHCVIVGNDAKTVLKLMRTLALFLEEDQRKMSIKPYCLPFSPYLYLQAVQRKDFDEVLAGGTECHWPITIVDLDRKLVTSSGPYIRHRNVKKALQIHQVGHILREAGIAMSAEDERKALKEPVLDLHSIKPDDTVQMLLTTMRLLPQSRTARMSYIDHFLLRIENKARAFIAFVEEISEPKAYDKRSAISARWSLSATRRSLNLVSEASLGMVLARAECLMPTIAEFVAQNTKR